MEMVCLSNCYLINEFSIPLVQSKISMTRLNDGYRLSYAMSRFNILQFSTIALELAPFDYS